MNKKDTQRTRQGLDLFPSEQETPAVLGALQKADIVKWWPVIKAAGIKAE